MNYQNGGWIRANGRFRLDNTLKFGGMEIESKIGKIENDEKTIYQFLSNFNNFKSLVPADKIKNWSATEDHCHFTVAGMGETGLRIIERTPSKLIKITTEAGSSMDFLMWIQLKQVSEKDTRVKITLRAELNPMISAMIKGPLKTFADTLIDQMEAFPFIISGSN
jgi:carbon monoxide dehydrogenase subunit G